MVLFGLLSTTLLITTHINSTHFEAAAFLGKYLPPSDPAKIDENEALYLISGERRYFWIFTEVFHKYPVAMHYWDEAPIMTNKTIMVIEDIYDWWSRSEQNKVRVDELMKICNLSQTMLKLSSDVDKYESNKYPFTSILPTLGIGGVEIKASPEIFPLFRDVIPIESSPCNRTST
jgi:hypothetical protein